MKIAHISDLHIGRRLMDVSLLEDQAYILNQFLISVQQLKPDVILITGDIYDKNSPSEDAFQLWDDFLVRLAALAIPTLVISGNHDSNARLGVGSYFMAQNALHVVTKYEGKTPSVLIGKTYFHMIPFVRPTDVKNMHPNQNLNTYQEAYDMLVENIVCKEGFYHVLLGHQFFTANTIQPQLSDSEVTLSVGGLDAIDLLAYTKFDYIACGHIHRPQRIGNETRRYAGSPLKYSFSEAQDKKSFVMVTLDKTVAIDLIPLKPLRDVRVIKGPLEQLMNQADPKIQNDYIHAIVTDEMALYDPFSRLRATFPNLLHLTLENLASLNEKPLQRAQTLINQRLQPMQLFETFFESLNGRLLTADEHQCLEKIVDETQEVT